MIVVTLWQYKPINQKLISDRHSYLYVALKALLNFIPMQVLSTQMKQDKHSACIIA